MPTTRKETRRVVPNREVVRRERGWRCGGGMVLGKPRGLMMFAVVFIIMESWYGFTEAGEVRRLKGFGGSAWRSLHTLLSSMRQTVKVLQMKWIKGQLSGLADVSLRIVVYDL